MGKQINKVDITDRVGSVIQEYNSSNRKIPLYVISLKEYLIANKLKIFMSNRGWTFLHKGRLTEKKLQEETGVKIPKKILESLNNLDFINIVDNSLYVLLRDNEFEEEEILKYEDWLAYKEINQDVNNIEMVRFATVDETAMAIDRDNHKYE